MCPFRSIPNCLLSCNSQISCAGITYLLSGSPTAFISERSVVSQNTLVCFRTPRGNSLRCKSSDKKKPEHNSLGETKLSKNKAGHCPARPHRSPHRLQQVKPYNSPQLVSSLLLENMRTGQGVERDCCL